MGQAKDSQELREGKAEGGTGQGLQELREGKSQGWDKPRSPRAPKGSQELGEGKGQGWDRPRTPKSSEKVRAKGGTSQGLRRDKDGTGQGLQELFCAALCETLYNILYRKQHSYLLLHKVYKQLATEDECLEKREPGEPGGVPASGPRGACPWSRGGCIPACNRAAPL